MEEQLTVSNQNPIAPSPPAPTSPAVGNQPSSRLLGVVLLVVVVAVGGVWAYQSLARSNTPASLLPPSTKSPASEKEESSAPKTSSFGDLSKGTQPSSPGSPNEPKVAEDISSSILDWFGGFKEAAEKAFTVAKEWRDDAALVEAFSTIFPGDASLRDRTWDFEFQSAGRKYPLHVYVRQNGKIDKDDSEYQPPVSGWSEMKDALPDLSGIVDPKNLVRDALVKSGVIGGVCPSPYSTTLSLNSRASNIVTFELRETGTAKHTYEISVKCQLGKKAEILLYDAGTGAQVDREW